MNLIISFDDLIESLPLPDCLSGVELTVLCKDGDAIPIILYNELAIRKIKASFKEVPALDDFSKGFMYSQLIAAMNGDNAMIESDIDILNKLSNCLKTMPLAKSTMSFYNSLQAFSVAKDTKDSGKTRRRRTKKAVDNKKVASDKKTEVITDDPLLVERLKEEPSDKANVAESAKPTVSVKASQMKISQKFYDVLQESGVNEIIDKHKRDYLEMHKLIYEAVKEASEAISFEIQLRIRLLDTDLSADIYKALSGRFNELKKEV